MGKTNAHTEQYSLDPQKPHLTCQDRSGGVPGWFQGDYRRGLNLGVARGGLAEWMTVFVSLHWF